MCCVIPVRECVVSCTERRRVVGGARGLGYSSPIFKGLESRNSAVDVYLLGSTEPAFNRRPREWALRQTWDVGMHLTRGPCVECSAPHTRLHCSMLWTKLCVISVGPASLDLLLCVLMCFGSGHCWEIAAHLCGCLRNKRGREVCFCLKHSVGLKRGIVCKMSLIPWGFLSSFRPSYSPSLADSGLE